MENDELLHKWIAGDISEAELKTFQARPEFESLAKLYKQTEHLSAPEFDQDIMLQNILDQKKKLEGTSNEREDPKISRTVFLTKWIKYGVAATVLLLVGLFYWAQSSSVTTFANTKGENTTGTLPDESTFNLNAESELSFNEKSWPTKRSLELSGEAYFEVKKGSTFKVNTNQGSVQVLGTHFNVFIRDEIFEVSCQEGRVAVFNKLGKKLAELTEGEATRITAGIASEKWSIGAERQATWINGIFKFRKVTLLEVLQELERQFDIKIDNSNINAQEIVTCNFQKVDLEMALKTTLQPMGIQFEIRDSQVILSK